MAAVKTARQALELWVRKGKKLEPKKYPKPLGEKRGVFVTLHTWPERQLRGCIGFPEPVMPLIKAIIDSACAAAEDPRFPPVQANELDRIVVEVSILTKPELIKAENPEDYPKQIKIGTDGLIVRKGMFSGLLLPQVAVEWNFSEEEFLSHTCQKAGLPDTEWLEPDTKIYKFRSEIFSEKEPRKV